MTQKTSRSGYSDRELMYTVDPAIKGDVAQFRKVRPKPSSTPSDSREAHQGDHPDTSEFVGGEQQ